MFFVGCAFGLFLWWLGLQGIKIVLGSFGVRKVPLSYPMVAFILLTGVVTSLACGCSAA